MAIGDLSAEQQVRVALVAAQHVIRQDWPTITDRELAGDYIREALKRMDEAGAA